MTLRSSVIVFASLLGFATASAAPRGRAPRPKPPSPYAPEGKPTKKQMEIDKHEWMAQYHLRKSNDMAAAAKEYQAILALDPQNASAAIALASIYAKDKKEKQAIDVLVKLTKKNPTNLDAWTTLAELQAAQNDDKGFKVSIAKALEIDPTNTAVHWQMFYRAQKKLRDGDATAKADVLEAANKLKLLERNKASPSYRLVERAVVELSGDPLDLTVYDAKTAYSQAFESGMMGRINAQMGQAKRGFEECIKSAPKNEECHFMLGMVMSSVKASDAYDPKKALEEFALAPGMPLAFVETARIHRGNDNNLGARAALEKALSIDDELAVAHIEMGILDKLDGKLDEATKHFVAAVDAEPWGANASKAIVELTKVAPTHRYVQRGMMGGKGADVFTTDRFKSVVKLIEQQLGGVEKNAPEQQILEDIIRKLVDGSGLKVQLTVSLVGTRMVNAFALADGHIYVTRGMIDLMKKKMPSYPMDANHPGLGHILGHEVAHVVRRHTMTSQMFQEAVRDASRPLDPSVVTHVTRINEIDADREGIVMAFLAGFQPRGGIEFMEVMGRESEIPKHLDHPTFEERVQFLTEYWTNDVRYAFVSFKLGVAAMDQGTKLESTDMGKAIAQYDTAVEHFKRFRTTLPSLKEAMNDLGIAYTKLGVLAMKGETPLARWQTRYSLERDSSVKYQGLVRSEEGNNKGLTRGAGEKKRLPWQLREAIAQLKEAVQTDENYSKARLNLAAAYLAANQLDNARDALGKVDAKRGVVDGDIELVRGVVLAEARDYDKAKAAFDLALRSQAAKRAASYNIARVLELAGKKADAKRAYQQYAKLYPGGPWAKAATSAAGKL